MSRGRNIRRVVRPDFVPTLTVQASKDAATNDDDTDSEQSYRLHLSAKFKHYMFLFASFTNLATVTSTLRGSSTKSNCHPSGKTFYDRIFPIVPTRPSCIVGPVLISSSTPRSPASSQFLLVAASNVHSKERIRRRAAPACVQTYTVRCKSSSTFKFFLHHRNKVAPGNDTDNLLYGMPSSALMNVKWGGAQ